MYTKFTYHKQYLLALLFSRNPNKTLADQSILQHFLLCVKRNNSQIFKSSNYKKTFFRPVCMSLVQLASMNVFYFLL